MKILLPYKQLGGASIHDETVMGGIERFGQLVYRNLDNVIPIEYTEEDQKKRRVTDKIVRAARAHNVDVILSNYDNETATTRVQERIDVPIAWFCHNLGTSISKVKMVRVMPDFVRAGGSVFMVTRFQHDTWNSLSERINGPDVSLDVSGYIPSSCCSGQEPFYPTEKSHDTIVVARCDKGKDPFLLNRKVDGTNVRSTVITSMYKNEKNTDYYEQNLHWTENQFQTLWNVPHSDVITHIARSRVLVSTLPEESFGITALEALSCGVPIILFCKPHMQHASSEIPAHDSHVIRLRKSCKQAEFVEAYQTLAEYSEQKLRDIYESTQVKHSVSAWTAQLTEHLQSTIDKFRERTVTAAPNTLDQFL